MHVMKQPQIGCGVEAVVLLQQPLPHQQTFNFFVARFGQFNLPLLFIYREIALVCLGSPIQRWNQGIDLAVHI